MAPCGTSTVVGGGCLAPPAFVPKPAPVDDPICTPPQLLTASPLDAPTMAVSSLLSWAHIAQRTQNRWALPLQYWMEHTFVFEKGEAFPKAVLGSRTGRAPDADVAVLVVFEDLSSLALWAPWDGDRPGLYTPLPVAFRKLPAFQAFVDPQPVLKVVKGRLIHVHNGQRQKVDDPKAPIPTQAIHMGLVQSLQAWMRSRPQGLRPVFDAPTGEDWGEDADEVWYVPPCAPHSAFDDAVVPALQAHLDHAATLLSYHHKDHVSAWRAEVRARARKADGTLAPAQVEVQAINAAQTARSKEKAKVLETALLRALRLPSCPLPYAQMRATSLYWPASGGTSRRDRIVLTPTCLWRTHQEGVPNAHKRMAAIAALGGMDWI
jgi:hypothetical protein